MKKLLLFVFLLSMFVLLTGCGTTTKETTTIVKEPIDLSSYDIEATLEEIFNEYSANHARGNKTYMNKRIKITAPIYKIETEYNGVLGVIFDAAENDGKAKDSWTVVTLKEKKINLFAGFDFKDGDDNGILDYNVGDKITIIGRLTYANGNTLGLKESKIVSE